MPIRDVVFVARRRATGPALSVGLLGAVIGASLGEPAAAQVEFDALPFINVTGFGNVATETDYVPNVVQAENGLASFEALKAQAVAARTFAYYQMDNKGFINNGTSDQVYEPNPSNPTPPRQIHLDAAAATEGEILWVRDNIGVERDVLIASFYVAGAIPPGSRPFNFDNPGVITQPGDSDPTSTQQWVTYTYANGDTGGNNLGTPLGFQGTPTNPNWPNRGAKSQNGADYLSDNSVNYLDILKYYYGADIQLRTVTTDGTGVSLGYKTLTNFDDYGSGRASDGIIAGHEGVFHRAPDFSGSTTANLAGSTADRTDSEAFSGSSSQLIDIQYDESSGTDFLLRHVAGAKYTEVGGSSNAAARIANLQFNSEGSVGFYLKTDDPGLQVSIALDDPTTADRGLLMDVIADGQWHKYEWFLDESLFWEPWLGGGNGQIDGDRVTLDSIQLFGNTDAQVYLDEIFWDPTAEFAALIGDYNFSGQVEQGDLDLVLQNWGVDSNVDGVPAGWLADLPTGLIEQNELDRVLTNWGDTASPDFAGASNVPEPASLILLTGLSAALTRRRCA